jgi:hypothetical protein
MLEKTKDALAELGVLINSVTARGMETVSQPSKGLSGIYGIENLKEVATPICGLINTAINKKGIIGIIGIIPDIYPAYDNFAFVDDEFLDMDESEFEELKEHIKAKLVFDGTAAQYEAISEEATIAVIRVVLVAIRILRLKKEE